MKALRFPIWVCAVLTTLSIVAVPVAWGEDVPGEPDDDEAPFTGFEDVPDPPPQLNEECIATVLNRMTQVSSVG